MITRVRSLFSRKPPVREPVSYLNLFAIRDDAEDEWKSALAAVNQFLVASHLPCKFCGVETGTMYDTIAGGTRVEIQHRPGCIAMAGEVPTW